ncbi:MAG: TetR/AcrR family transcriptional regulator [Desulfobulbaceae bacterium]|nr:TetR/AcrR family transcriptional regulator [Desulfobulbaceae bacterium]MDP2106599.1 TetR/AcrR family transcriptional regulator [Desulfobulbaceae bacterium]
MSTEKMSTDIRKEQIVEAALRVLSDKSIKQLNIVDIAKEMGLTPSALYRHFKNKNAMMSGVLELIRTKLFHNVELVRQQSDDAVERLHELLCLHARLIAEEHGIPKIVFSDELWGQKRERRQKMYRIITGYLAEIEDIIRDGQDKKQLRDDIEARTLAAMFFGIIQPAALLWHMSEGQFNLDRHMTESWELFLGTIKE